MIASQVGIHVLQPAGSGRRGVDRQRVRLRRDERTVTSRLVTPETYALTVDAATTAAGRLESDDVNLTGYHTPATAFDPEFVLELHDVEGFFDDVEEE